MGNINKITRWLWMKENGQSIVEYALILTFVVLLAVILSAQEPEIQSKIYDIVIEISEYL